MPARRASASYAYLLRQEVIVALESTGGPAVDTANAGSAMTTIVRALVTAV